MVLMIIKGLFRRYERWNPVHPTSGSFWGMGIGLGCGVGWGPGFGPEVVGYVGAGCGVGFNVGITFAGLGIGLPTNVLIEAPFKAVLAARSQSWDFLRASNFLTKRKNAGDEWNNDIQPPFGNLQLKAIESFPFMKDLDILNKGMNRFDMKSSISMCTKSVSESFRSFRRQFSDPGSDIPD